MKNLILTLFFAVLGTALFGQAIEGGAGVTLVTGDPDAIANLQTPATGESHIAFDRTNQILYLYDPSGGALAKWNGYDLGNVTNTNTQVVDANLVGNSLQFDVEDIVASTTTTNAFSVDLTSLKDGVITGFSTTGTGTTRSFTITRSVGADITGSINVDDGDSDDTNEIQTITTNGSGVATLSDAGGSLTFVGGNAITVTDNSSGSITIAGETNVYITSLATQSDGTIVATLSDASTFVVDIADAPTVDTSSDLDGLVTALGAGESGIAVAAVNNALGVPAKANWGTLFFLKK